MINRAQLNALVERVSRRLAEAGPLPAKTGDFRYKNDGTSVSDSPPPASGTAKTQMPTTQHPPTMAAAASPDEAAVTADGAGKGTHINQNPNRVGAAPSQKTIKVNSIKKALDMQGYTKEPAAAKRVNTALAGWYDQLDPADAMVSTADELALRFTGEG